MAELLPENDPASPAQKPGWQTSEIVVTVATILTLVVPIILEKIPEGSMWAVVLGMVATAAAYIGGRSMVKASGNKAAALVEAAKVVAKNPQ